MKSRRFWVLALWSSAVLAGPAHAQQVPDSTFDTRIARPAHTKRNPRLLFDEGHHNFHTAGGRYQTFAALARNDRFVVIPSARKFARETLEGNDVLVISNAMGHEDMADTLASRPAFTDSECDAVRDWVRAGGALLLIADHAPMGASARPLASRFGVELMNGYTLDSALAHPRGENFLLLFTRANGGLADHPITRGRDTTERVTRVKTFAGESMRGPRGSVPLLVLSPHAIDLMVGFGEVGANVPAEKRQSAAGRA